jgi:hypothetical protein
MLTLRRRITTFRPPFNRGRNVGRDSRSKLGFPGEMRNVPVSDLSTPQILAPRGADPSATRGPFWRLESGVVVRSRLRPVPEENERKEAIECRRSTS